MNKKATRIALVSLVLAGGAATLGAVSAQTAPATTARAADYASVFLGKLAAALGVDETKLRAAVQQAGTATVDEALRNQDITRAQADRLRQAVRDGRLGMLGRGASNLGRGARELERGGRRPGRALDASGAPLAGAGRAPLAGASGAPLAAAASALGVTADELRTQLRAGRTLEAIAKARGVSAQKVTDAIVAPLKAQLDAAVKAGRLSQARADRLLAAARQNPLRALSGRAARDHGGQRGLKNPKDAAPGSSGGTTDGAAPASTGI